MKISIREYSLIINEHNRKLINILKNQSTWGGLFKTVIFWVSLSRTPWNPKFQYCDNCNSCANKKKLFVLAAFLQRFSAHRLSGLINNQIFYLTQLRWVLCKIIVFLSQLTKLLVIISLSFYFSFSFLGLQEIKVLKVGPPPSEKIVFACSNGRTLKMMKNAFYFMLKALFILKIFIFLPRLFWSNRKMTL